MPTKDDILGKLQEEADPEWAKGMTRFAVESTHALGIPVPRLRAIAREAKRDHKLALELWKTGVHEARILASMVDDPEQVTQAQMESWVGDFDSWDVCDQCCGNLFDKTPYALEKAVEWSEREETFVRRAGFALMAYLAVHDKRMPDAEFVKLLPIIKAHSRDERNFVKKSVNWALRQIGKRNAKLNKEAIQTAKEIGSMDSATARWIASDALRELESDAVRSRLRKMPR